MTDKNHKRRKYLLKLYPALIKLGLLPLALGGALTGKTFENTNIVADFIGVENATLMDVVAYLLFSYLMIFPICYLFTGLQLFEWNWINLLRSFRGTFSVRYSLFRQPTKLDTDRVIRDFNRSVKKAALSILDDYFELTIPMPRTVDAQKMMHGQEDIIRERIGLMLPRYALSSFERRGMMLVLIGSRH